MTTVVGIDPSLTGTALSWADQLHTIESAPYGRTLDDRWTRLIAILRQIHVHLPDHVDLVVIEAPSLGQARQGGTLDRNGLWWITVDHLRELDIPVLDVPPATLKKFATGKGNATKPDMRMALYKRAGLDLADDNQVDAWWLAELGRHLTGTGTLELPATHLAALDKLQGVLA